MTRNKSFKDKCFKDNNGEVVIGQTPNLPLKVATGSFLIGLFLNTGVLSEFVDLLTFGAFFTFAWLELFQGVNYLRRFYGLIVLIILFSTKLL